MWVLVLINLAGKAAALSVGWHTPAVALTLWFGPDLLLAYHVFAPNAQGLLQLQRRFVTPRREVWLTIDDGATVVTGNYLKVRVPTGRARNEWVAITIDADESGSLRGSMTPGKH